MGLGQALCIGFVHKQAIDGCSQFRPILSVLQTLKCKCLVPTLDTLTKNEYTVKDSFHFDDGICEQDYSLSMGSLDASDGT